ncbi:MAG TPA: hypothetical protein VKA02_04360 [Candidatus Acidoferrum sp.]|nr:hypothetical protein [Candidatus Acidoferrum sp.]
MRYYALEKGRIMPKANTKTVVLTTSTGTMEVSGLTLQEVKELAGLNGHANPATRGVRATVRRAVTRHSTGEPDFIGFKQNLSVLAKKFLDVLRLNPNGIRAETLAEKMGVKSTTQIGGITGGGMSRLAKRFDVDLDDVYSRETSFEGTERRTIYKPGKDIAKLQ